MSAAEPAKRRGRPPGTTGKPKRSTVPKAEGTAEIIVTAPIDPGFHAELVAFARQADLSIAQIVRRALREFVARGQVPRL